ncbi:MAG: hypothetical protein OES13_05700 [Acidimicrobiia bacterium]|nr:hypothetical protein [Acidimicrobiia bacterium]
MGGHVAPQLVTEQQPSASVLQGRSTRSGGSVGAALVASAMFLMTVAACGGGSDPLEPEAYFASVSDAVTEYSAGLDAVDEGLLGEDWTLPPAENRKEVDEFYFAASAQAKSGHLGAWKKFIDELNELGPPDGIAQLGGGFEAGFPEYIQQGVLTAEREAYEANEELLRHEEDFLEWFREWDPDSEGDDEYRERRMKADELLSLAMNAEDSLEDEWEDLEGFAHEAGFDFDAADLRTSELPGSDLRVSGRFVEAVRALVDKLRASQPAS